MNKKIIVITGDLASGKTTYGLKLSEQLNLPFLSKDRFKEVLFEAVSNENMTYHQKKKLGATSYAVLYECATQLMKAGTSFIIESNFIQESAHILKKLIHTYQYSFITLRFCGDLKVLHERFLNREYTHRSMGLQANGLLDSFEAFEQNTMKTHLFSLGEPEIKIDTTNLHGVDLKIIVKEIEKKWT